MRKLIGEFLFVRTMSKLFPPAARFEWIWLYYVTKVCKNFTDSRDTILECHWFSVSCFYYLVPSLILYGILT